MLFSDNGENDIDMSTIVEQTMVENGDVGEEQLFQDNEEIPSWSSTESPPDDAVARPQPEPENTESPSTLQVLDIDSDTVKLHGLVLH